MSRVTVVTVSVPERAHLLAQAGASVQAQTIGPVPWLIRVDEPQIWGPRHIAYQRNRLLDAVDTEWMAVLDDDDLFDPTYLERCAEHFHEAEVVYTYCRNDFNHPEGPFDAERLMRENFIDGECLIRTDVIREFGGYPVSDQMEDWELFKRLAQVGARFVCIPERLRDHRHGGWRTVTS